MPQLRGLTPELPDGAVPAAGVYTFKSATRQPMPSQPLPPPTLSLSLSQPQPQPRRRDKNLFVAATTPAKAVHKSNRGCVHVCCCCYVCIRTRTHTAMPPLLSTLSLTLSQPQSQPRRRDKNLFVAATTPAKAGYKSTRGCVHVCCCCCVCIRTRTHTAMPHHRRYAPTLSLSLWQSQPQPRRRDTNLFVAATTPAKAGYKSKRGWVHVCVRVLVYLYEAGCICFSSFRCVPLCTFNACRVQV